MSYSHTLNIENHSHIIGRQDGVTGDSIKANDTIVFCAACQSVFLKESWEYMNSTHCNQSETLDFVPSPIPKLTAKKKGVKLIFETFNNLRKDFTEFVLKTSCFFIAISVGLLLLFFYNLLPSSIKANTITSFFSVTLIIGNIIGSISLYNFLLEAKSIRKITGIDKNTIRILETGIELRKYEIYSIYEIRQINYSKTKKENKLIIYLKNGEVIYYLFPKIDYEETKSFLYALVWIAQFVPVRVYTENQKEHGFAKSIERNYVAKFLVVENSYVLDVYN
ncbi:hypothetical protein ACE193_03800 [Bernardetia sp. OM2101]|uniref:hypothetical protein n=1 Tax=Bernardetia sp. OM2101 TaxID=3344876 RepID=UPI0035CF51AD